MALPSSRPSAPSDRRHANFFLALVFLAFTYALFTYRAYLRFGDAYQETSTIRLLPIVIGAGLYWLVLSKLIDGTRDRPGKPLAVVATILPASIVVLLARVILDQFGATNPNGFAGDLRFVMVWAGYFGLWVSVSLLLRTMNRSAQQPAAPGFKPVAAPAFASAPAVHRVRISPVERLSMEIAGLPDADRRALIQEFTIPLSYETADEFELRPYR